MEKNLNFVFHENFTALMTLLLSFFINVKCWAELSNYGGGGGAGGVIGKKYGDASQPLLLSTNDDENKTKQRTIK